MHAHLYTYKYISQFARNEEKNYAVLTRKKRENAHIKDVNKQAVATAVVVVVAAQQCGERKRSSKCDTKCQVVFVIFEIVL